MNSNSDNRPYFLWDYDLTENDVRRILAGNNETEKIWMMSRILDHAAYRDVWNYLRVSDIVSLFPKLRMRKPNQEAWKLALTTWGYHV